MISEEQKLRWELESEKTRVRYLSDRLAEKNRELDALHYVWCNGGCDRGVHRWQDGPLTEDIVITAESQAARLRAWWNNAQARAARQIPS